MADTQAGPKMFLEAESRVAMLGVQDAEATVDNIGGACQDAVVSNEIDGLCYRQRGRARLLCGQHFCTNGSNSCIDACQSPDFLRVPVFNQ